MSKDIECGGTKLYRFQPCFEKDGKLRGDRISPDKLWFSSPGNLNDPMDIDHHPDDLMSGDGGDSPLLRDMAKVMYGLGQDQFPKEFITDDLLEKIRNWSQNGGNSLDICHEFKERLLQLGVACFTPDWNNPPMWAHYANNWQGFAIEYSINQMDMAISSENKAFWQFGVNYSSRIEQTSLSELLFAPYESVSRILSAKTTPWSYEREWRLIYLNGGDRFVQMPIGMRMSGIILGPKSPCDQKKLFEEKCLEWKMPLRMVNVGLDKTLHLRDMPINVN